MSILCHDFFLKVCQVANLNKVIEIDGACAECVSRGIPSGRNAKFHYFLSSENFDENFNNYFILSKI